MAIAPPYTFTQDICYQYHTERAVVANFRTHAQAVNLCVMPGEPASSVLLFEQPTSYVLICGVSHTIRAEQ